MRYHLFIDETGNFGKRTKVKQSSFTLVHRLCICALALSQNMDITGEETLKSSCWTVKTGLNTPRSFV